MFVCLFVFFIGEGNWKGTRVLHTVCPEIFKWPCWCLERERDMFFFAQFGYKNEKQQPSNLSTSMTFSTLLILSVIVAIFLLWYWCCVYPRLLRFLSLRLFFFFKSLNPIIMTCNAVYSKRYQAHTLIMHTHTHALARTHLHYDGTHTHSCLLPETGRTYSHTHTHVY